MAQQTKQNNAPDPSNSSVFSLQVLGGFALLNGAGEPIELTARKSRMLLAYLAVPAGQTRTREQLAALLWSDRQEEQARGSLRTALSGIRRAIGDAALIVGQDSVSLRLGHLTTDYDRIKQDFAETRQISSLEDIYPGNFLDGHEYDGDLYGEWLRMLRTECADFAIALLEANANRLSEAGEFQPAISLMRDSLSLEPLKEHTHRTIMQLYAASGERAMAMAQYRACKDLLRHELDAEPAPDTQNLADRIALLNPEASSELHRQITSLGPSPIMPIAASARPNNADSTQVPSIAILPFVNMSGDAEQNYFADGMTEDIITELCGVDAMSVVAKSASQMYRGAAIPPAQISAELGARYLLEGSVRKAGDSIRISAHLNDASSGLQIWANRYDRQLENIFQLQSEISCAIVSALKLTLARDDVGIANRRTTTNVEAYQYYMRGQVALQDRSRRSVRLAYDLFKQAVVVDPDYALAYAGIASSAATLFLHYDIGHEMLAEALEHCDTALGLQPGLAEAYAARGTVRLFKLEFDLARDDIQKALDIAPDLAQAHFFMGQYHLAADESIEKAYVHKKRAFELSSYLPHGMMFSTCLRGLEKWDELREVSENILCIAQRKFSLDPYDAHAAYMIAHSFYDLGQPDKAKHWASVAAAFDTEDGAMTYNLACLHSVMGLIDESLAGLDATLRLGSNELKIRWMASTDPDLDQTRQDPRFKELLTKYGYDFRT